MKDFFKNVFGGMKTLIAGFAQGLFLGAKTFMGRFTFFIKFFAAFFTSKPILWLIGIGMAITYALNFPVFGLAQLFWMFAFVMAIAGVYYAYLATVITLFWDVIEMIFVRKGRTIEQVVADNDEFVAEAFVSVLFTIERDFDRIAEWLSVKAVAFWNWISFFKANAVTGEVVYD